MLDRSVRIIDTIHTERWDNINEPRFIRFGVVLLDGHVREADSADTGLCQIRLSTIEMLAHREHIGSKENSHVRGCAWEWISGGFLDEPRSTQQFLSQKRRWKQRGLFLRIASKRDGFKSTYEQIRERGCRWVGFVGVARTRIKYTTFAELSNRWALLPWQDHDKMPESDLAPWIHSSS